MYARIGRRTVILSAATALLVLFNLPFGATADADRLAPSVVVDPGFVGVVDPDQDRADLLANGTIITWIGDGRDGSTRVLWASSSIETEPNVPEFVGAIDAGSIDAVRSELAELGLVRDGDWGMASADAYGAPSLICSLYIPDPWLQFGSPDNARASDTQTCTGALLEHRVEGWLHMNTWWVFYSTKDSDSSGWGSATQLSVSLSHPCDSEGPKNWRNKGSGEAFNTSGVHFGPVTGTTNWRSLGCLG